MTAATARKRAALALVVSSAMIATAGPVPAGSDAPPRVLVVIAHPDDESMFAGSVYKLTHSLGAVVDLAVVTDGSGGFRYATLAEPIYGLRLTDEAVARKHLPAIRKRELEAGGRIIGIRDYVFLDQLDHAYTENVDTVLRHVWDSAAVRTRLADVIAGNGYDFVLVHLPIPDFHAHHKAATILALQAVRDVPRDRRPLVLGGFVAAKGETSLLGFRELAGHPITRVREDIGPFVFDRTQPIGLDGRLDYRIVVNWLIAEHKTQGTMQLLVNQFDVERFWVFAAIEGDGSAARRLFERLAAPASDSSGRP